MTSSPFRERRFHPADVRRIVRRAAELAEQDASTDTEEQALTQPEIEERAAALGLPERAVRAAIADDAPADKPEGPADLRRILLEEEFDGELAAEGHEDVVEAIQVAMGDTGRVQIIGKTLTWTPSPSAGNQQRQLTVTVRSRNGKT